MNSTIRWIAQALSVLACVAWPGVAEAQPTSTQSVQMRDGVSLLTDVYVPLSWGEYPVLLIRTPYGRAGAQADGNAWRAAGVAVVAQDMRGRGGSGGVDCVFLCDGTGTLQDGVDTLDWIALQTWSNGNVVTYGSSAVGVAQYVLAPAGHPTHRAMWAQVATPSFYDHAFFNGGVFREHMVTTWLTDQGSTFFLDDVAAHPLADSFWDVVQTGDQYPDVQVPTVHLGGWYDIFGQGTIDAFVGYQHQGGPGAQGQQKLIMGPWVHGAPAIQAGELTYPASALDPPTASRR